MVTKFDLGQNALDVCKIIVKNQKEISEIKLIAHKVDINWRQQYKESDEKISHMLEGFKHSDPVKIENYDRDAFQRLSMQDLHNLNDNQVWSITSKVICYDGSPRHIAMMNFHPEGASRDDIKEAIGYISGDRKGVLLDSGRFTHYYGDFLLDEKQWTTFMAEFLMPVILVSPRYIGHRLNDGYCTLRLTNDKKYKPEIPQVIDIL